MTTFVRAFLAMHGEFHRVKGPAAALKRALCSLRMLAFPGLMRRMSGEGYLHLAERKRGADGEPWDPFHFISHPGYLVQGFSLSQRFEAALYHYRQEAATFDEAMLDQVYSQLGFELWSAEVDGHRFSLRLGLPGKEFLEGDLCVRLTADGRPVGTMNFIWADGAMFGGMSGPTIFITRCQTHTWPELAVFRACFKQNSPPYFCLAALAGLGQVCGLTELYAVQHQAQMSYEPKYASNFRNSYDEFWEKFNATPATPLAYRLALPLALRDLSELKSKHRSRAEGRRRSWGEVGHSAGAALAQHLRGHQQRAAPQRVEAAPSNLEANALCVAALVAEGLEGLPLPLLRTLG
jgi:uncharacterized protein VirK/YbjX